METKMKTLKDYILDTSLNGSQDTIAYEGMGSKYYKELSDTFKDHGLVNCDGLIFMCIFDIDSRGNKYYKIVCTQKLILKVLR